LIVFLQVASKNATYRMVFGRTDDVHGPCVTNDAFSLAPTPAATLLANHICGPIVAL
jgi:hypothetical protein